MQQEVHSYAFQLREDCIVNIITIFRAHPLPPIPRKPSFLPPFIIHPPTPPTSIDSNITNLTLANLFSPTTSFLIKWFTESMPILLTAKKDY